MERADSFLSSSSTQEDFKDNNLLVSQSFDTSKFRTVSSETLEGPSLTTTGGANTLGDGVSLQSSDEEAGRKQNAPPHSGQNVEKASIPIQPWSIVRQQIGQILQPRNTHAGGSRGGLAATGIPLGLLGPHKEPAKQPQPNSHILSITLPHGFQLLRTILHPRPTIRSAVYISVSPQSDIFVTLDTHNFNLFRGTVRSKKFPISLIGQDSLHPIVLGGQKQEQRLTYGISKWTFHRKWKLYIIATTHLQLRVLDMNFEQLSSINCDKSILNLEVSEKTNELIVSCVGGIHVYTFVKKVEGIRNRALYYLQGPRFSVTDLDMNSWILYTYYHEEMNRLYATLDSSILIYDYETGKRLDQLRDIHELTITACIIYEPLEYLITAGKDAVIKIWNSHHYLVHEYQGHLSAITGLMIPPIYVGSTVAPIIMSCSMDHSIRMWNLETYQCIYRLDTHQECLGMGFMKKDTFFHFSKKAVYVWTLNRYQQTFTFLRSPVTLLKRYPHPKIPARIVCVTEDASIRIISPVSGNVLLTGFPVHSDVVVLDISYDIEHEKLYALLNNGDIAVYDVTSNPCPIQEVWAATGAGKELCKCIAAIEKYHPKGYLMYGEESFWLLGGSTTGQLIWFDLHQHGKQISLAQAHSAEIHILISDSHNMRLFSSAGDQLIKIWKINIVANEPEEGDSRNALNQASAEKSRNMWLEVQLLSVHQHDFIPLRVSLSPSLDIMAIANEKNKVVLSEFLRGELKNHSSDEDHASEITALVYLKSLHIFASSSMDGTTKIWDTDNNLIREIQLNEPVLTLCFANDRGDLLLGLSDHVSLVKISDYLPLKKLREIHELQFNDDLLEVPIQFDSNLDFWDYCYHSIDKAVVDWHVRKKPKEEDITVVTEVPRHLTLEEFERKRHEREKRKRERILLDKEKISFTIAKHFEPVTLFTAQALRGFESELDTDAQKFRFFQKSRGEEGHDEFPEIEEESTPPSEEQKKSRRVSKISEFEPPTGLAEIGSPEQRRARIYGKDILLRRPSITEQPLGDELEEEQEETEKLEDIFEKGKALAPRKFFEPQISYPSRKTSLRPPSGKEEGKEREKSRRKHELKKKQSREKAKVLKTMDEEKVEVKPKEVVIDISDKKSREKDKSSIGGQFFFELLETRRDLQSRSKVKIKEKLRALGVNLPNSDFQKASLGNLTQLSGGSSQLSIKEEDPYRFSNEKLRERYLEVRLKLASRGKTPQIQEEPSLVTVQEQEKEKIALNELIASDESDNEEIPEPPPPPEPVVVPEIITQVEPKPEVSIQKEIFGSTHIPPPKVPKPPKKKEEKKAKRVHKKPKAPSHPKAQRYPEVIHVPTEPIIRETIPIEPVVVKKKKPVEPQVVQVEESQETLSVSESEASTEGESEEEGTRPETQDEAQEKAAQATWDLFRKLGAGGSDPLQRMTELFWFPGLNGKPLTVSNIIAVLLELLGVGLWSEKCEALKALLCIYQTFCNDILNPVETLILPQLERFWDDAWQVRAQLCSTIASYDVYNGEIIYGLICCLADENNQVKQLAMGALSHYGINSKDTLRHAMQKLGMLPEVILPETKTEKGRLELLLEAQLMDQRKKIKESSFFINHWLMNLDTRLPHCYPELPDPFIQTLTLPSSLKPMSSTKHGKKVMHVKGRGASALFMLKGANVPTVMAYGKLNSDKNKTINLNFQECENDAESLGSWRTSSS